MINNDNLKKARESLSTEFNNNIKLIGTWEFTQLNLSLGYLKDLIRVLDDPKELIKANKIYKESKRV